MSEQTIRGIVVIAVLAIVNGLVIFLGGPLSGLLSGCLVGLAFTLGERNDK